MTSCMMHGEPCRAAYRVVKPDTSIAVCEDLAEEYRRRDYDVERLGLDDVDRVTIRVTHEIDVDVERVHDWISANGLPFDRIEIVDGAGVPLVEPFEYPDGKEVVDQIVD